MPTTTNPSGAAVRYALCLAVSAVALASQLAHAQIAAQGRYSLTDLGGELSGAGSSRAHALSPDYS